MNVKEKKDLLQDFLDKLWYQHIYLIKQSWSDYGDGECTYHEQEDEDVIEWYLRQ